MSNKDRKNHFEDGSLDAADEILNSLFETIYEQQRKESVMIINSNELRRIFQIKHILEQIVEENQTEILLRMDLPNDSYGSIAIVGKKIGFRNTKALSVLIKNIGNFDVYSTSSNEIVIEFTFKNLSLMVRGK